MPSRDDLDMVAEKYGGDWAHKRKALCLIHDDTVPSVSVSESGLWNCHACGKGGDAITLIREKEGCDYEGARNVLASITGRPGNAGKGGSGLRGKPFKFRLR